MSNILFLNVPRVDVGLVTDTYTVPIGGAGIYNVAVQLSEVPVTGLSVVVNRNGSPIYTAPTITPTQIAQQFKTSALLADSDVITVVLSSTTAVDLQLNTVKTNVSISLGE
jgi:hypothetical protein